MKFKKNLFNFCIIFFFLIVEKFLKHFSELTIEIFRENSLLQILKNNIFSGYKFGSNLQNDKSFLL